MSTPKKTAKAVSAHIKDLKPKKNPKAGALNAYIKLTGQKQGSVG